MWAYSIDALGQVAVVAKHLEPLRVTAATPPVGWHAAYFGFTLSVSTTVDVVDTKESKLKLTAAGT
jgi:hypothetical protein